MHPVVRREAALHGPEAPLLWFILILPRVRLLRAQVMLLLLLRLPRTRCFETRLSFDATTHCLKVGVHTLQPSSLFGVIPRFVFQRRVVNHIYFDSLVLVLNGPQRFIALTFFLLMQFTCVACLFLTVELLLILLIAAFDLELDVALDGDLRGLVVLGAALFRPRAKYQSLLLFLIAFRLFVTHHVMSGIVAALVVGLADGSRAFLDRGELICQVSADAGLHIRWIFYNELVRFDSVG